MHFTFYIIINPIGPNKFFPRSELFHLRIKLYHSRLHFERLFHHTQNLARQWWKPLLSFVTVEFPTVNSSVLTEYGNHVTVSASRGLASLWTVAVEATTAIGNIV